MKKNSKNEDIELFCRLLKLFFYEIPEDKSWKSDNITVKIEENPLLFEILSKAFRIGVRNDEIMAEFSKMFINFSNNKGFNRILFQRLCNSNLLLLNEMTSHIMK